MASVSGSISGTASASASVMASTSNSSATSVIVATVQAEADGIAVTSTGNASASGAPASVSVTLAANSNPSAELAAEGSASANANAEAAEGSTAQVTASTDVNAVDGNLVISKEQMSTDTDGNHPVAESFTHLEAYRVDAIQAAPPPALEEGVDVASLDIGYGNEMEIGYCSGELWWS
jgi:hypothetical protein